MPFDSRTANFFLELDTINERWRDLALLARDAGSDAERKRIASLMEWEQHFYAEKFAELERAVKEYRPKISRAVAMDFRAKAGNLDRALSAAQDALGRSLLVQGGSKRFGGLYALGYSAFEVIEQLRRALAS